MELFDYQGRMITEARAALRLYKSVLLQAPTGSGKTVLASFMLKRAVEKNVQAAFICHRRELIDQTAKTFDKLNLPYGFVAAGLPVNPFAPLHICSIDTLKSRIHKGVWNKIPRLVIWDECHHTGAAGWSGVKAQLPDAMHIGLTATPERLDGKGLEKHFDHMILGPPVMELIKRGFLSDYRIIAPAAPNLDGIKKHGGDYARGQLEAALLEQNVIIGDIVETWKKFAKGKD